MGTDNIYLALYDEKNEEQNIKEKPVGYWMYDQMKETESCKWYGNTRSELTVPVFLGLDFH